MVDNGINATLYTQAANSPDVNLLDLGFFRAIQSFNDAAPKNEKELIEAVSEAYDMYPHHKINQTWLSLHDRIPSTTPGAEPPRDAKDSGSARSHSTHLETSSSNRP